MKKRFLLGLGVVLVVTAVGVVVYFSKKFEKESDDFDDLEDDFEVYSGNGEGESLNDEDSDDLTKKEA